MPGRATRPAAGFGSHVAPRASLVTSPANQDTLLRLAAEPGRYGFYRWQHVAINLWASQPTAAAIAVLSELTERSLDECPRGIASIHWLEEGVALPTPEARVALSELAKRYERHVLCVGVLLAGSGFWASATRSALTGIMLLAPRTFFLRFFSEPDELALYIQRELNQRGRAISGEERLTSVFDEAQRDFHG